MIDLRCYTIKYGAFDGELVECWVQIFLDANFEDENDMDSPYYFHDINVEEDGVPVFATREDYWNKAEKAIKEKGLVKRYKPQFILSTNYETFREIVEKLEPDQEAIVEIVFSSEREMIHYAFFDEKTLLVAK